MLSKYHHPRSQPQSQALLLQIQQLHPPQQDALGLIGRREDNSTEIQLIDIPSERNTE